MSNVGNKVINIVKRLNDCILDSDNNIKASFSGEIKEFMDNSTFEDMKDRLDFCVQFVDWLLNSDYLFNSTKEFLKQSNVGVKDFFESRNRAIVRYNNDCEKASDKKELYIINTCINRVQTDRKKLESLIDSDFLECIMEDSSDNWKKYQSKFMKVCKGVNRLTVSKNAFAFDIDRSNIATSINKTRFEKLLSIINPYATSNMIKELEKLDSVQLGYLNYLCSVKPQKVKDKDNYNMLMSVINGTYESELDSSDNELNDQQLEYDRLLVLKKELEDKEKEIAEKEVNSNNMYKDLLSNVSNKIEEILTDSPDRYEERFNKLNLFIKSKL